ncbi:MAG: ANTAR domain-containing protein [Lachnospiraceae bacterium]|nr:ANTAR domain-containing protein [Lachnospiraceae bacterium]
MGSVLISMPKYDDAKRLSELLSNHGLPMDIEVCQTGAEVLRVSNDRDFGVVISTQNLKDMGYHELSQYLPKYFGMIILTKDMALDIYSENVVKLLMPFKTRELISTIDMMTYQFARLVKKKKAPPKRSPEEQRLIDEAKGLLMNRNGMTEQEAFRYIQKSSMDTGRSMVESAQMILLLNE